MQARIVRACSQGLPDMTSLARFSPDGKILWLVAAALLLLPDSSHAAATCAEVRAQNPAAQDGTYALTLGSQQVALYCHGMASTPREYLTLPRTGAPPTTPITGEGRTRLP